MNTKQYMTVGEMMIHFQIDDKFYASFTSWVCKQGSRLVMPNEIRKQHRRYDVQLIEQTFPYKEQFNTRSTKTDVYTAAEMLAEAMTQETGYSVSAIELLRKYRTVTNHEEFRQEMANTWRKIADQVETCDRNLIEMRDIRDTVKRTFKWNCAIAALVIISTFIQFFV